MTYDRADWHYGGEFPEGLPPENGATHIGMFLGWAIKSGLVGDLRVEDSSDAVTAVRDGSLSGRDFLMQQCDEKLTDEDLSDVGNRFAKSYYDARYLEDYEACVGGGVGSLYEVADSAENRAQIEALLDQRLQAWRAAGAKAQGLRAAREAGSKRAPWWRFW